MKKIGALRLSPRVSVHVWNESVGDVRAILVPVPAVLEATGGVVAHVPVDEETSKVNGVEVRDDVSDSAREAPSETHKPVPRVIDVPR